MFPRVSIVSIGTELTTGKIRDSHGAFLASLCVSSGMAVDRIVQLPDNPEVAADLVRYLDESDVLLVTGGLGLTADDLTRDLIADVTSRPLRFHEDVWAGIQGKFPSHPPSATNRRQAEVPDGFEVLENRWGTAPGFHGRVADTLVIVLPGPPGELRPMCEEIVGPMLRAEFGGPRETSTACTSFLVPESRIAELIETYSTPESRYGTRAELDRVVISVYGEEGGELLRHLASVLGPLCFAEGETTAQQRLVDSLSERDLSICTAESCTGGLIAKLITDVPGSSSVFWGGVVAYDDEAKSSLLAVRGVGTYGAVSAEVVREMAQGALGTSGTDLAISVSGIAGPGGGTEEKPVGTVFIGIGRHGKAPAAYRLNLSGGRDRIRRRTAVAGLLLALGATLEKDIDSDPLWNYI